LLTIDGVKEILRLVDLEVVQQHFREQRARAPLIRGSQHGSDGRAPDPVSTALVAEDVSPAAGPDGLPGSVAPEGDRSCSSDDHDASHIRRTGFQRDQGVVDDDHARLEADALHDAAHDGMIVRPVDTGNSEADGGRDQISIAERLLHHLVQDLLHLQLSNRLQVGTGATRRRDHRSLPVSEEADRLRGARVDPDHMKHRSGWFRAQA